MYNLKYLGVLLVSTSIIIKLGSSKINDKNIDEIIDISNLFI